MLKTETRVLAPGFEMRTTQLPALRALPLVPRLASVLGPVFNAGINLSDDDDGSGMVALLVDAMARLGTIDVTAFARDLFCTSVIVTDGKILPLDSDASINRAFDGRPGLMIPAMRFAIEVSFSDFLSDALGGNPENLAGTKAPENQ